MDKFAHSLIVTPIDYSEDADRAVDFALDMASSLEQVRIVHVAQPLIIFEPSVYEIISDEERRQGLEASFHKRYAGPKYQGLKFDVRFGDPGQEIVDFATEVNADLIVMPSHGRTGLRHLLIGSVAERVVRLAKCPVLVLRSAGPTL